MRPDDDVAVSRERTHDGRRTRAANAGRDGRVVVLGAVAVLLALAAVVGTRVGTETLRMLGTVAVESSDPAPLWSGTRSLHRLDGLGRSGPHLVAVGVTARLLRDASVLAGGAALALGCWVGVIGAVRVLGRR
ncbi:hypothetical protein [Halorubrum luteum]